MLIKRYIRICIHIHKYILTVYLRRSARDLKLASEEECTLDCFGSHAMVFSDLYAYMLKGSLCSCVSLSCRTSYMLNSEMFNNVRHIY